MAISTVTVSGTFNRSDGTPSTGYITFQLNTELSDGSGLLVSNASAVVGVLTNGNMSVVLYATDEATTQPTNASYTVTFFIDGQTETYSNLALPHSPATLNVAAWVNLNGGTNPGAATNIAGGDLTGIYPNPTIAKVQGTTISGTVAVGQILNSTSSTAASWTANPTIKGLFTAYGWFSAGGSILLDGLATPSAPTVTPTGGTGATSYSYYVVARDANGNQVASSVTTTTTGVATLSGTTYNAISWAAVANAVSYDVLKTNTSTSLATGLTVLTVNDVGQATAAYTLSTSYPINVFNQNGGSSIWNLDNAGNMGVVGSLNLNMTTTTLNGTTVGTAVWSQPYKGSAYKKVVVFLNGYENTTATAQTITFPTAFSHTPYLAHDDSGGSTASTTTLTLPASMGATKTGWVVVEGF